MQSSGLSFDFMVYLIHFTEWCALNSAILLLSYLSNEPNHANHKLNEWELFEIYFGQIHNQLDLLRYNGSTFIGISCAIKKARQRKGYSWPFAMKKNAFFLRKSFRLFLKNCLTHWEIFNVFCLRDKNESQMLRKTWLPFRFFLDTEST